MTRFRWLAAIVVSASALLGSTHDGHTHRRPALPGLWYVTGSLGPVDPATPVLDAFMNVSSDGTALFDSTAETGENPVFSLNPAGVPLGDFTPAHAVWARVKPSSPPRHRREYELRFASFSDGGGAGFRVLVFTMRVRLDSADTFSGRALAADVPCETGAFGEPRCPNPQDVGYPVVEGNPEAFPIFGKRIVFER